MAATAPAITEAAYGSSFFQLTAVQDLLLRFPGLASATALEITLKHQLQQLQVEAATTREAAREVVDEMFG